MKKKRSQNQKKAPGNKSFNFYQVVSKNKKFNFGAFPANKEGLGMARSWAEKMTEETGEKFMVKKR